MFRLYSDLYGWTNSKKFMLILPFAYVRQGFMQACDLYPLDGYYQIEMYSVHGEYYEDTIEKYYRKRHGGN